MRARASTKNSKRKAKTRAPETRILVFVPVLGVPTETFIRTHIRLLPGPVHALAGRAPSPYYSAVNQLSRSHKSAGRFAGRILRRLAPPHLGWKSEDELVEELLEIRPDVVLAEFGGAGLQILPLCQESQIPLVVHFHGHDASAEEAISNNLYRTLFKQAAALVAVSKPMVKALKALGAPAKKIHYIPYGVRIPEWKPRTFSTQPRFLTVGRFVEKKGMMQSLRAFHALSHKHPLASLQMIGEGPLRRHCELYVKRHQLNDRVRFLGELPHDAVFKAMEEADCFLQHSVTGSDGDSEGTPVAILEASVRGLPIVSTTHAGIPEAVRDGKTGYLVKENDIEGMMHAMEKILTQPKRSLALGRAGHLHIKKNYSQKDQVAKLHKLLEKCGKAHARKRVLSLSTPRKKAA